MKKLAEKKVKQLRPEAEAIAREMAIKRIRGEVSSLCSQFPVPAAALATV